MSDANFVWFDLMTTDPEGAKAFYTEVAGWGLESWDADPDYAMWTVDGKAIGGVRQLPEATQAAGVPPNWLGYVTVPDSEATARQITALGGTVLMTMNVPPSAPGPCFRTHRARSWPPSHRPARRQPTQRRLDTSAGTS